MKTINIIKFSLTIVLIIIILSQCISAGTQDATINNIKTYNWQRNNVFFYIHAYSDEESITNQNLPVICFVKDINLSIFFEMLFWPLFIKIKVWNNSGLIFDGIYDFFYLIATNFTGLIIHTKGLFRYEWYLFGYCNILKIEKGY
ncbi:MAG: hypothetical protein JSV67_05695 [Thermoplasmatales archaeon]|nr:MAG: hypothetical protein JSV67_05695 [Thermoplasmatales archaeon]